MYLQVTGSSTSTSHNPSLHFFLFSSPSIFDITSSPSRTLVAAHPGSEAAEAHARHGEREEEEHYGVCFMAGRERMGLGGAPFFLLLPLSVFSHALFFVNGMEGFFYLSFRYHAWCLSAPVKERRYGFVCLGKVCSLVQPVR